MTRLFTVIICLLPFLCLPAQEVAEESGLSNADLLTRSFTSIQANTRALELVHERRLGDSKFTIQGVAGVSANPIANLTTLRWFSATNRTAYVYLSAEPRYYYNLAKRAAAGKVTANNSGGFIGLRARQNGPYTRFRSGDEGDDVNVDGQLYLTPRWGIRRQIGDHVDFELAVGMNTRIFTPLGARGISFDTGLNIHWRFGYRF